MGLGLIACEYSIRGHTVWHEFGIAICLMLIIEGIIPFLYPSRWRAMVTMLSEVDDRALRIMGLCSMLIGTGLLYLVN